MVELPDIDNSPLLPVLENLFDGVAVAAPAPWRLVYINPTLARWLRQPIGEVRGRPFAEIFAAASRPAVMAQVERVWRGEAAGAVVAADLQLEDSIPASADVRLCRVDVNGAPLLGVVVRWRTNRSDPAIAPAERRDPLTGLADRDFLLSRVAALLRGERAADHRFAVLFIDLDNFKQVNDAHGHLVGDRVLREIAGRLTDCVREGHHVVRFGGDEFVVLLERVAGPQDIEPVTGRIHAALAEPIALPEGEFTLSLSIGVAEASPEHRSPEDLLRAADRAMYAAKRMSN